jgi:hypothetical protein
MEMLLRAAPAVALLLLGAPACEVGSITSGPGEAPGGDGGGGGGASDGGGGAQPDSAVELGPDATPSLLQDWCQVPSPDFSFFVTSMNALWTLSGDSIDNLNGGMGGDFGGLAGADAICQEIGTATGHGDRTWRAFLSVTNDGTGSPVDAIDRIGSGPWHDANGRLVATGIAGLTSGDRPDGDPQSTSDLPDECGVPTSVLGDAHDTVTGSNTSGRLSSTNPSSTCNDWTSSDGSVGGDGTFAGGLVRCGHSFPRSATSGRQWMDDHQLRGCGKGANLLSNGSGSGTCSGCTGGYGAIYCFAE